MSTPPRPFEESAIVLISQKLENLQSDTTEMRSALRELATAVTKLYVIEERQSQTNIDLSRAFREIDKCHASHEAHHNAQISEYKLLQLRIAALELQTPLSRQTNEWVSGAVWACVAVIGVFFAKKVGLM